MMPPVALNQSKSRSRPLYALLIVLVIGAGLLWRSRFMPVPPFLTKYGGDALWALMVFVGLGFVFNKASTLRLGFGVMGLFGFRHVHNRSAHGSTGAIDSG